MAQLRVKDWKKFQHYKNRRPPWIKLYRTLLDDYDYVHMSLASMALAPLFWLIASESDGEISSDCKWLSFRTHRTEDEIRDGLQGLIEKGFIIGELQDASNAPATRRQDATPETERERETETEKPPHNPPMGGVVSSHGKPPRKTRQRPNTGEVVNSDPNVKKVLDSYYAGYRDGHGGTKPLLEWGRAGVVAQGLLASGNDPRLVALVAYLWGKNPPADYVAKRRSSFYSLQYSFNDMVHSLLDGRELDLNSPALPISRFFSDPPAGQAPPGDLDPLSGSHGNGGGNP